MNVRPSMSSPPQSPSIPEHQSGPHLGVLATFTVMLFLAGFAFVTKPSFPSPTTGTSAIVTYFQMDALQVRMSTSLSFAFVTAFGLLVASLISRLRLLGVRSAWVEMALFTGFVAAFDQTANQLCTWALTWPAVAQSQAVTLGLYYLLYGLGGPGFCVPIGLFVGCVCLAASSRSLLPNWISWVGVLIAIIGMISWLTLLLPTVPLLVFTLPATRFPAFVWLIAAGFTLPKPTVGNKG